MKEFFKLVFAFNMKELSIEHIKNVAIQADISL